MRNSWIALSLLVLALGASSLLYWWNMELPVPEARTPVEWDRNPVQSGAALNPGTLITGIATASNLPGRFTQFRGPDRANHLTAPRSNAWPGDTPAALWNITVGEGHAGVVIQQGRVYLIDYDRDAEESAIRCLSLDDGGEIWSYTFSESIKRNHGMSRTVPAINDQWLVAMSPKCRVLCLNVETGELNWEIDLKAECGTTVPPWYAGQCPLIDGDQVILAPGADPLMMAVDLANGEVTWETPDHAGMGMTHSSIVPITLGGVPQYVYCAGQGVVGVEAATGQVLWTHPGWKIGIANIPTPVPVGGDRLFFTGGYNSGSQLVQVHHDNGGWTIEELFRIEAKVFGSDQQTPIFADGFMLGVTGSRLTSLNLDGEVVWESAVEDRYGLGPMIMIGDLLYVLSDQKGLLDCYRFVDGQGVKLASAHVIEGHDAWAPMAYVPGRLVLRDLTQLICLEI